MLGLTAISTYAVDSSYKSLYQHYASRSFDRSLDGKGTLQEVPFPSSGVSSPARGALLGRLEIPAVALSVMVLEGTDSWILNRAPGHIEGTAFPGEAGNTGIAGHRDTDFNALRKITRGMPVFMTTLNRRFEYRIVDTRVVGPKDSEVLANRGEPMLTLVTCYPFDYVGPAPKRFIVHAALVAETAAGAS